MCALACRCRYRQQEAERLCYPLNEGDACSWCMGLRVEMGGNRLRRGVLDAEEENNKRGPITIPGKGGGQRARPSLSLGGEIFRTCNGQRRSTE